MVEAAQPVVQAVNASGLKREAVARILGVSKPTANKWVDSPDEMPIGKFFALYYEMDDFSAGRLWDYLEEKKSKKADFFAKAM